MWGKTLKQDTLTKEQLSPDFPWPPAKPIKTRQVSVSQILNGERITNTEWHNVVLWRGLAQVAEKYVKKGTQLYIEGRIKTRSYDDQDGNKKYVTEIVGDQMQLLSRKPDETGGQGAQGAQYGGAAQANNQGQAAQSPQAAQAPQTTQPSQPSQTPETKTGETNEDPFAGGDNGPDDLPF
jgi:single-strand DNA-binding protein